MKTRNFLLCFAWTFFAGLTVQAKHDTPVQITSPNGQIAVVLNINGNVGYTVKKAGKEVYRMSDLSVTVNGKDLGKESKISSIKRRNVKSSFSPVVPLKFSTIHEDYQLVDIKLNKQLSLQLRVMNNAVAYRFLMNQKGMVNITDERMNMTPSADMVCHLQQANNFNTSYEEAYKQERLSAWKENKKIATLPALLSGDNDLQLLMGESDVDDYPRQFLQPSAKGIQAVYPKSPTKWEPRGDRGEKIIEEGNYISRTTGRRSLPWRWVVITDAKGIIEQTVPIQLARRNVLKETSWIKPGQVSWEWWNGATPFGPDVDFKAGNNYDTYKYFIDFASRYGIEYILLDEGWAKSTRKPFIGKEELNLPKLIRYGQEKGVGIILWLPWLTVEQHMDVFKTYAEWGVKGVKIDFMDHSDQWMVNYYKRVVDEAAKHQLLIDFHGSFTPAGLEHEYPNLISYEGVRGMEQMGGCRPDNSVYLPFIRNTAGAMDYTPGAMNNYQPHTLRAERPNSGSIGTRAYQLALYVVFESGVQMLADNPTLYYQNDDCTRFITSVPTTWDETRAVAAEVGQYVVVAKRKGAKWYVGAICNGEKERTLDISFDFLTHGKSYKLTAFKDGKNADYQAMHYNIEEKQLNSNDHIQLQLAKNGGWAAVIE